MIGEIIVNGKPVARMEDDGTWTSDDSSLTDRLNVVFNLAENSEVGDHHLPFGMALGVRAAAKLGGEFVPARPIEPLPPGVIS